MLRHQKEIAVRVDRAKTMTPEELAGKITIGTLVDRDLPVYTEEYQRVRDAARAALDGGK
jgi:2-oxoglutarate ferredoxin oxidoreductase subunit beta